MTAAVNLLLTLINQVHATPPLSPTLLLSLFNFSYIDVTPPRTTTVPCDDSNTVPPSSCVYLKYAMDKYSLQSLVDIGLMMILTIMILPTILMIILIILPMMFLVLLAITSTHMEQDVLFNGTTMNTVKSPTTQWLFLWLLFLFSIPTRWIYFLSQKKMGKRKELHLQQCQYWAVIQKLHCSHIGSSCSGFQWSMTILYKLSMPIWALW